MKKLTFSTLSSEKEAPTQHRIPGKSNVFNHGHEAIKS